MGGVGSGLRWRRQQRRAALTKPSASVVVSHKRRVLGGQVLPQVADLEVLCAVAGMAGGGRRGHPPWPGASTEWPTTCLGHRRVLLPVRCQFSATGACHWPWVRSSCRPPPCPAEARSPPPLLPWGLLAACWACREPLTSRHQGKVSTNCVIACARWKAPALAVDPKLKLRLKGRSEAPAKKGRRSLGRFAPSPLARANGTISRLHNQFLVGHYKSCSSKSVPAAGRKACSPRTPVGRAGGKCEIQAAELLEYVCWVRGAGSVGAAGWALEQGRGRRRRRAVGGGGGQGRLRPCPRAQRLALLCTRPNLALELEKHSLMPHLVQGPGWWHARHPQRCAAPAVGAGVCPGQQPLHTRRRSAGRR